MTKAAPTPWTIARDWFAKHPGNDCHLSLAPSRLAPVKHRIHVSDLAAHGPHWRQQALPGRDKRN